MCSRHSCRIVAVVRNSEDLDKQAGVTEDEDQWNVSSSGFEKYKLFALKCRVFSLICHISGACEIGILPRDVHWRFSLHGVMIKTHLEAAQLHRSL